MVILEYLMVRLNHFRKISSIVRLFILLIIFLSQSLVIYNHYKGSLKPVPYCEMVLEEKLEKLEADDVGRLDYAASTMGGFIHSISPDTIPYRFDNPFKNHRSNPHSIIDKEVLPGNCFAFIGSKGSIQVAFKEPVIIKSITLSHVSKYFLGKNEFNKAPEQFEIYGFVNIYESKGLFLGRFMYDSNGRQHQQFFVKNHQDVLFKKVQLRILSNYGGEFTCVYRLRVHKS